MITTAVIIMNRSYLSKFFGGEAPEQFIYEDEQCVAFDEEKEPQAPVHFLVVPKKPIPRLSQTTDEDEQILGHLLDVARRVAKMKDHLKRGFRVVMNEGRHACHTRDRDLFYVQVLGGRQMEWPYA